MGLKIRQVINVLIDAPDKDKPFIVECRRDELDKCKYEWGQLEISKVTNCDNSSVADAYVRPEDKWWKDKEEGCGMTYEEKSAIVIEQLRADRDRLLNVLNDIQAEINTPNRGTCDYFIVDRIEEIINKYKTESEDVK